jgi:hypothetical protein
VGDGPRMGRSMNTIITCACGRVYTASQWAQLRYLGQTIYDWGEIHEMRDCDCGSTRVVVLREEVTS